MDGQLPPLSAFILPGGSGVLNAQLHVSRSVCRRLERHLVPLLGEGALNPSLYQFVNRLSDYLFASARFASFCVGEEDQAWEKIDFEALKREEGLAEEEEGGK